MEPSTGVWGGRGWVDWCDVCAYVDGWMGICEHVCACAEVTSSAFAYTGH